MNTHIPITRLAEQRWLERLLIWQAPFAAVLALIFVSFWSRSGTLQMAIGALVTAFYFLILLAAIVQARSEHTDIASLLMSAGLLGVTVCAPAFSAVVLPAATLLPVFAVAAAVPYLSGRRLRSLALLAGGVIVSTFGATVYQSGPLQSSDSLMALILAMAGALTLGLLTRQHRHIDELVHKRATVNQALGAAHANLADLINTRTTALQDVPDRQRDAITAAQEAEAALRESEARLRTVLEHMPVMLDAFDEDSNIVVWNHECERVTGYRADEIISGDAVALLYPDESNPTRILSDWEERRNGFRDWEIEITCKDGSKRIVAWSNIASEFPIPGWRTWGIGLDITERKRAEEALRESEARLRLALEAANAGVWEWNILTNRVNWSDENYRVLGYEPGSCEASYDNWLARVHPDEQASISARVMQAIEERSDLYVEMRIVRPDGSMRWLADIGRLVFNDAGEPVRMIGILIDITARKQAEEALRQLNEDLERRVIERTFDLELTNLVLTQEIEDRERAEQALSTANAQLAALNDDLRRSRDLLRVLFDNLQDGLAVVDRTGQVITSNQALTTLYDLAEDSLANQPWQSLCSLTPALVEQTFTDGLARRIRGRRTRADERNAMLDARIIPLPGQDQAVEQLVIHIVDMTEQLQLEAQVIERERFAANSRLAATVAHEVNTPLQAVESCLHLAGRTNARERAEYLKLAQDEIHRVGHILRQLLDLYRASASASAVIEINALIDRVLLLTGGTLNKHGINVERDLDPHLPTIWGRTDEITQVLLNLVMNAIHAMPHGGTLRLRTRARRDMPAGNHRRITPGELYDVDGDCASPAEQDVVIIDVSDTGVGMSSDVQARIFDPFFTTKTEGSGLGLAISQKIVANHGGQISVESAPNAGSAFTLVFPLRSWEECTPDVVEAALTYT